MLYKLPAVPVMQLVHTGDGNCRLLITEIMRIMKIMRLKLEASGRRIFVDIRLQEMKGYDRIGRKREI